MFSKTPSKLLNTWLSQNRSTLYPSARSHSSRILSPGSSACCPPSSSITTFFSKFTKSTKYRPMGCWRRNLKPSICLSLRCLHKCRSVSVEYFLSLLATSFKPFHPHPFPSPLKGEGLDSFLICFRAVFHKTSENILNLGEDMVSGY
jgi:hypothetical protein